MARNVQPYHCEHWTPKTTEYYLFGIIPHCLSTGKNFPLDSQLKIALVEISPNRSGTQNVVSRPTASFITWKHITNANYKP